MARPTLTAALCAAALLAAARPGPAAAQVPDDVWETHAHALTATADGLAGPGGTWIMSRADSAQFVLFGEQHGVAMIPEVAAATYTSLYDRGSHYLALEMGPWLALRLSDDGVAPTVARYPHSIAFDYDGEVELLRTVETRFDAQGQKIWGLDQASTAIHPYERLVDLAPGKGTTRMARGAFLKAALKMGEYTRQDHSDDVAVLRSSSFAHLPEAMLIADALEISAEIFTAHRAGRIDESVLTRENYMMNRLHQSLDAARQAGVDLPRAVFKLGGAHIMEGIGPNGVRTLGDEAQQIATGNGLDALHIGIWSYRPDQPAYPPASIFAPDSDLALVDTRALRESLSPDQFDGVPEDLRRSVRGYDAIILIRDAEPASRSAISGYAGDFRRRLLGRVGLLLIPMILGLTLLIPFVRGAWLAVRGRSENRPALLPWTGLLGLYVAALGVTALQILLIRDASPNAATISAGGGLFLGAVAVTAGCAWLVRTAFVKAWWSAAGRVHFAVVGASVAALYLMMSYWNLGGMLG